MAMSLEDIKKQGAAKPGGALTLDQIKSGKTQETGLLGALEPAARIAGTAVEGIPGLVKTIGTEEGRTQALEDVKKVGSYALDVGKRSLEESKRIVGESVERVGELADVFGKGTVVEKAAAAGRLPLQITGTTAGVLFSPLAQVIGDAVDAISDMPEVQRISLNENVGKVLDLAESAGETLDSIAKKHPDAAATIKDVADTLSLALGPKAVKTAGVITDRAAAAAGRATAPVRNAIARTAERVTPKFAGAETSADEILSVSARDSGAETAAIFRKYGIEAPVSAVTPSRSVQAAEAALQSAWFGGSKITKIVEDAQRGIARVAESLTKRIDPEDLRTTGVTAGGVGENLQKAIVRIRDEFNAAKDKLYTEAEGSIGNQQAVLTDTRSTLADIIVQKKASLAPESAIQVKYFQRMLNNMSTAEKRTFKNIKATRTEIGKKLKNPTDPITSGDRGNLKRLYAALSKDLDVTVSASGIEAANALKAADAFYKAGINKVNSFIGRTIFNARNPENIFEKLIKPGDITTVQELKTLLGTEDFRQVASLFMNNIIERSLVLGRLNVKKLITIMEKYGDAQIREIVGDRGLQQLKDFRSQSIVNDIVEKATNADGNILPATLAREIEKYGDDLLKNTMQPEAYKKLQDVYKLSSSMKAGTKIVFGSPTYEKFQIGMNALLFGTNIPVLLTKLGLEFGATKLFTTDWGRSLLTGGALRRGKSATGSAKTGKEVSKSVSAPETTTAAAEGLEGRYVGPEKTAKTRYTETPAAVSRETGSRVGKETTVYLSPDKSGPKIKGKIERAKIDDIKPTQEPQDVFNETSKGYARGDIMENIFTPQETMINVGKLERPDQLPVIVVDKSGNIIDGNHRWGAAKTAGLKEIDVIRISNKEAKRINEAIDEELGGGRYAEEILK